jgi:ribulose-5-phosphate 4-epimerase/fuculose-1-phosphate aldolase
VESAVANYVALENACETQLLAESAGQPRLIPQDVALRSAHKMKVDQAGIWNFRPMWERVLREQPDFLR